MDFVLLFLTLKKTFKEIKIYLVKTYDIYFIYFI